MRKTKKILSMVTMVSYLCIAIPQITFAVSPNELNNTVVFLKQAPDDVYCTLVAATNMLRRKAILNEDDNWSNIDTNAVGNVAWCSAGLYNQFTYGNYSVSSNKFQSVSYEAKKNELINLLNSHPEGIVIYKIGNSPHAILVTDFTDNIFYCADPSPYWGVGRIPISSASISLSEATKYWYISSDNTPFTNDPTVELEQHEVTQYRYRTRTIDYDYTTSNSPSLDGWELIDSSSNNTKSEWSDWQSTYIKSSDTCEVEERTIEVGTTTLIYLGRYYSEAKNKFSPYKLDDTYTFEGGWFNIDEVTFIGEAFRGGRSDCYTVSGWHYYFFEVGEFGGQTQATSQGTETQYRYRDILSNNEYKFKREIYSNWSEWSDWSEQYVSEDNLTQVEARVITK